MGVASGAVGQDEALPVLSFGSVEESDDMWIDRAICEFADGVGQGMILNPGASSGVVSVTEIFQQ